MPVRRPDRRIHLSDEIRFFLFLLLLLAAVWVDQVRGTPEIEIRVAGAVGAVEPASRR